MAHTQSESKLGPRSLDQVSLNPPRLGTSYSGWQHPTHIRSILLSSGASYLRPKSIQVSKPATQPTTTVTATTRVMSATAPFRYKKDGTIRTRRAPGTEDRYKGPAKTVTLPVPQIIACPVTGCNLNFDNTKNPKNSQLVHVRYKAGKGDTEHQLELEKMITARKTERMYQSQ